MIFIEPAEKFLVGNPKISNEVETFAIDALTDNFSPLEMSQIFAFMLERCIDDLEKNGFELLISYDTKQVEREECSLFDWIFKEFISLEEEFT